MLQRGGVAALIGALLEQRVDQCKVFHVPDHRALA